MFKNQRKKLELKGRNGEKISFDDVLLIDGTFLEIMVDKNGKPIHLNIDQAQEIIDKLNYWIDRKKQK